jgi:enoyl-CoA hydratase/carnithine racemase
MALTVFQESLDGAQAERCGLAWRCVPDGDLMDTALELARRAASLPPALTQKLHNTMTRVEQLQDYGPAVQIEMDEQLWSLRQPAAMEAIARRMQEIGYTDAAPPPPPPDAPPPPPAGAPKPGDPGFKLFADD